MHVVASANANVAASHALLVLARRAPADPFVAGTSPDTVATPPAMSRCDTPISIMVGRNPANYPYLA
jgi:hypothetical protein